MLWQTIGGKGITWNHHDSALIIKLMLQGIEGMALQPMKGLNHREIMLILSPLITRSLRVTRP